MGNACNGKTSCSYVINTAIIGGFYYQFLWFYEIYKLNFYKIDPSLNCAKTYSYTYTCNYGGASSFGISGMISQEAGGKTLTLSCAPTNLCTLQCMSNPGEVRKKIC